MYEFKGSVLGLNLLLDNIMQVFCSQMIVFCVYIYSKCRKVLEVLEHLPYITVCRQDIGYQSLNLNKMHVNVRIANREDPDQTAL